ncbi:tRNA (adenosine(37)-N6)-threonylcarbamoyltransferase complex dimerization subunit type 1 TsaB [Virgibacillus xinjiangensis]|uniref:tRNA (Adenosine(37)-N6)-threonylcarbamoyltransferase complex dimerization subunit type 1 TsaB n=1 Tax=Virgibacillus xinjiangensis TaxID=393090 RepID=A0ABV7D0A4_9BACI
MNTLAIDTSNQIMGVAILKDGQLIGEIMTNLAKNHSVRLMPAIQQLMEEVSMKPEDLDQIVVAKGPGSYTGVRIGLSTAKSMAWALGIPVTGVSSLEVLSYQGRFFNGMVCPFFDARRGLVYSGVFEWGNERMSLIREEANLPMEDLLEDVAAREKKVLFISPDIAKHGERIRQYFGDLAVIPDAPYHMPKAGHLALAAMGKEKDDKHTLVPNYLRLAEAEAKWLEAQKEQEK